MKTLIDNYLENLAIKLAEPQNAPCFSGLYHGKIGTAVFFCHYASYTHNDLYNDVAYRLITDTREQLYENSAVNYAYGLSGTGAGIEYLVQQAYFEADTDEILGDIDIIVSNHLIDYSVLSSFNQIMGIGKYLSFRIKTSKQTDVKKHIERVVNLIEMQLMRTPLCRPDILSLLYTFRNISEKASVLFDTYINLFDIKLVDEFPFEWFYFFYKIKNENPDIINSINRLLLDKQFILSDMDYLMWSSLSGNNIINKRLSNLIDKFETTQNFGLMNGLSGVGLTLLTLADKQNATWIELR